MKVLIAVDDTVFGDAIAKFITQHAWSGLTEFKVMHVLETPDLGLADVSFLPLMQVAAEEDHQRAKRLVRRIGLQLRDKFKTTHVDEEIVHGKPRERILEMAKSWKSDMIILGSHGRRGIDRFLLGSVSAAVVEHAPCSVVVVRIPDAKSPALQFKSQDVQEQSVKRS